jgi:hypothetical protein
MTSMSKEISQPAAPAAPAADLPARTAPFAFIDGVLVAQDPAETEVQRVAQPDALATAKR